MRWTAAEHYRASAFLYAANRARTVDDIEAAIGDHKCPGMNWVYADDRGDIGHFTAAAIPLRDGFDGLLPVPGWDSRYEWKGFVPTAEQPHQRNPPGGWIATANNRIDQHYPHVISNCYAMPDRFVRIRETAREGEARRRRLRAHAVGRAGCARRRVDPADRAVVGRPGPLRGRVRGPATPRRLGPFRGRRCGGAFHLLREQLNAAWPTAG